MTKPLRIEIKRIYETASPDDGLRVLVDRLWPRGVTRDAANIHHWKKELGPSNALRQWFGHRQERWEEFRERYEKELRAPECDALLADLLLEAEKYTRLTLVYSAKDPAHNQAVVLSGVLAGKMVP